MLIINKDNYILKDVIFYKSPNFDERPKNVVIDTIIIHCISLPRGEYGNNNVIDLFQNQLDVSKHSSFSSLCNLKVSSHIFIDRKGQIIQFVPFNCRAWHAGKSCYNSRENFNDFSIGIELEGTSQSEFEEEQYTALNSIILSLKSFYSKINSENILGHSQISSGRKDDPGKFFDWEKIRDN